MNRKECIEFASRNPICFLATAEGDQAHVRAMRLEYANESGFYFATLNLKEVSKQLHQNPKVEVCFYNHATDLMEVKMMRIKGRVEFIDEPEVKERVAKEREELGLDPILAKPIDPYVEIFKVNCEEFLFWTVMDTMEENKLAQQDF
jgi:uncharacterized pyridoxamine 5'-phosphate oxidase family protein